MVLQIEKFYRASDRIAAAAYGMPPYEADFTIPQGSVIPTIGIPLASITASTSIEEIKISVGATGLTSVHFALFSNPGFDSEYVLSNLLLEDVCAPGFTVPAVDTETVIPLKKHWKIAVGSILGMDDTSELSQFRLVFHATGTAAAPIPVRILVKFLNSTLYLCKGKRGLKAQVTPAHN
jgi:hypothetical protein